MTSKTERLHAMADRTQLNRPLTHITENNFLVFATGFRYACPRGIRDMVYKRLYYSMDTDAFLRLREIIEKHHANRPSKHFFPGPNLPRVFNVELCSVTFVQELVATIYEQYPYLTVQEFANIKRVLGYDFFHTGVKLNMCILSRLEITAALVTIVHEKISQHFEPLLQASQKLRTRFELLVVLVPDWDLRIGRYSNSPHRLAGAMREIDVLVSVSQKLKPVYAQLREKCKANITTKLRYAKKVEWDLGVAGATYELDLGRVYQVSPGYRRTCVGRHRHEIVGCEMVDC
jgi:hypothetical protein